MLLETMAAVEVVLARLVQMALPILLEALAVLA
jgi:hypothetical protein